MKTNFSLQGLDNWAWRAWVSAQGQFVVARGGPRTTAWRLLGERPQAGTNFCFFCGMSSQRRAPWSHSGHQTEKLWNQTAGLNPSSASSRPRGSAKSLGSWFTLGIRAGPDLGKSLRDRPLKAPGAGLTPCPPAALPPPASRPPRGDLPGQLEPVQTRTRGAWRRRSNTGGNQHISRYQPRAARSRRL